MGWLSEHQDPFLKKEGWLKCGTCGYTKQIEKDPPVNNTKKPTNKAEN
jgi:uncharacterized Zn finger protein (UPF0148 family)